MGYYISFKQENYLVREIFTDVLRSESTSPRGRNVGPSLVETIKRCGKILNLNWKPHNSYNLNLTWPATNSIIETRGFAYSFKMNVFFRNNFEASLNGSTLASYPFLYIKVIRGEAGFRTDCFKIWVYNTNDIILQTSIVASYPSVICLLSI